MSIETDHREDIRDLVARTASLLDAEDFDGWLGLFDADGTYEMRAYSTEIRRWMLWQHSDRDTLARMLSEVGDHVRDPATRRHVVGYPIIGLDADQSRVTSNFSLYRTTPEGKSSLYMVGCYQDRLVRRGDAWLYAEHTVVVDTRMLDMFTHIPV
jgi:3-phenylpropionate/cinnamic acid dioxygenase small subunit